MTLKFLLHNNLLDDAYGFRINDEYYQNYNQIPSKYRNKVIRCIRPGWDPKISDPFYSISFVFTGEEE